MRTLLQLIPTVFLFLLLLSATAEAAQESCEPYRCADGTAIARCSEDGHIINYFAPPCMTHRGEANSCSKEECGPAMGMPNWQCPDGSVGGPVCGRTADGTCGWHVHDCPNDSGFSDVPTSHENSDAIFYVKSVGIVEGYSDGTYKPDATINRAEFVAILMRAYFHVASDFYGERTLPFVDTDSEAWYVNWLYRAIDLAIIGGYPDGTFRPAANINLAEAAKILVKSSGLEASTTIPACDGDCPWYRPYVLMLEMKGAIPMSIARFDQNITRGEMAEMIYRLRMGGDHPSRTYEELEK